MLGYLAYRTLRPRRHYYRGPGGGAGCLVLFLAILIPVGVIGGIASFIRVMPTFTAYDWTVLAAGALVITAVCITAAHLPGELSGPRKVPAGVTLTVNGQAVTARVEGTRLVFDLDGQRYSIMNRPYPNPIRLRVRRPSQARYSNRR